MLACIANFSGTPEPDYRVGLPFAGRWREVLNTDAEAYGGSGVGNLGAVEAEQQMWHGRPASAVLQLPPSGVLWLAPEPFDGPGASAARPPRPAPSMATEPVGRRPGAVVSPPEPSSTARPTLVDEPRPTSRQPRRGRRQPARRRRRQPA